MMSSKFRKLIRFSNIQKYFEKKTEPFALKLEYNHKIENTQDLRKNVLKELKMGKKISQNLTRE